MGQTTIAFLLLSGAFLCLGLYINSLRKRIKIEEAKEELEHERKQIANKVHSMPIERIVDAFNSYRSKRKR